MKSLMFLFALLLAFQVQAESIWSCRVGNSFVSFSFDHGPSVILKDETLSLGSELESRSLVIEKMAESFSHEMTLTFRNTENSDESLYGDQIAMFTAIDGQWRSFYYAYTKLNDLDGSIYEYDFDLTQACGDHQEIEALNILLNNLYIESSMKQNDE